ncbi:C-type lectin domain-containing protein 91 [Caenorhabditis elegans]|uniref:C-type lectin domain-containing protein 91 n=1 Tax=Caenorhabditis elegans TaxID=6239 RepID=CLC91_CAEEL|nr:C-type lectin domain-containing protein 91 [Caenorhabditis elegans]Q94417.1 RecName: Full=C-type lectin domain-containing protein 91; Flags: Precursor [Caenorhabditis elegans]CAB02136.1 C-type lectin domain-containing protein 91 [Caenorhabditis elegans]|eukprot:NP_492448.1 C-type lectin domain-containing protein 91 [Caenorhabditis elegans]
MRSTYILIIVPLIIIGGGVVADNTNETPVLAHSSDEQPHQRLTYYNWDHKDLGTSAFEDLPPLQDQPTPLPIDQSDRCPDGWLRYSDSCYFIETESLGFAKAERKCHDKQATLFVANSMEEWDAVRDHAEKSVLSWIGLVRFSHYERLEQLPRWQTTGSINPSKINWLIKPFKPVVNGWSSYANCAASFQSPTEVESASYTFFYPCTMAFKSICERNSTILNARN